MSWINEGLDALSHLDSGLKVTLAGAFSFAESGLGVGMFVPGETVVLILSASTKSTALLVALFIVVALCGSAGDHVGYLLGRRFGSRLRETRFVARMGRHHWDRAAELLQRYGATSVFLTRLIPIVRTLTPAAAGVGRVAYRRFLPASLLGAMTWSALYVCGGALAAVSVERVEAVLGGAAWVLFGAVGLVFLALVFRRRRNRARAVESRRKGNFSSPHANPDPHTEGPDRHEG